MKKLSVILISIFFLFAGCQKIEFNKTFETIPEHPQKNEKITVKYLPNESDFGHDGNVEMIVYQYSIDLEGANSIKMNKEGKGWIADFTPDKNSNGAFVVFSDGNITDDNNSHGYKILLSDSQGNTLPEAIGGEYVALSQWAKWYLDFKSDYHLLKAEFEELFQTHPNVKNKFLDFYLYILSRIQDDASMTILSNEVNSLKSKKDLTAEELIVLSKYSDNSEEYENMLMEKFPQNKYSEEIEYGRLLNSKTPQELKQAFNNYKAKYKNSELVEVAGFRVIKSYIDKGDVKGAIEAVKEVKDITHPFGFKYAVRELLKNNDFKNAKTISEIAVEVTRNHLNKMDNPKPKYYTKSEWKEELEMNLADALKTLAMIQKELGENKIALKNAEESQKYFKDEDVELNELYASLLIYNENFEEAKEQLENYFKENKSSSIMEEMLKTVYLKLNKTEEGFEEYFSKFTAAGEAKLIENLKNDMINEPAPDFELTDLDGKKVKLSNLEGKIVIVDFWATWCGPCKQSFPAMQKVNDKYKNDENVKFLFVNTWENAEDKFENARSFIKENNYKLTVLIDDKNEVVSKFGVSGIPTKFIIGADKNIKFKSVGFSGTNDELIKEVSAMISLIKKKK